jgi:hypothetical protein
MISNLRVFATRIEQTRSRAKGEIPARVICLEVCCSGWIVCRLPPPGWRPRIPSVADGSVGGKKEAKAGAAFYGVR